MDLNLVERRALTDGPLPPLFAAWLKDDPRAKKLLGPPPSHIEDLARTADEIDARRGASPCVVTGQQSHWLGGPAFVLYKTAMARAVAAELGALGGTEVATWFWSHSDDADASEVDHLHVVNQRFDVQRIGLGLSSDRRPLYARALPANAASVFAATFEAMLEAPFKASVASALQATLSTSNLADHFAAWMRVTHPGNRARIIEPRTDREISTAVVLRYLECARTCCERWREVDRICRDADWDLPFDAWSAAPFFLIDAEGKRVAVRYDEARDLFTSNDIDISAADLRKTLENGLQTAIPGALLRVVLQSYLLPVSAYIGGPSELAYQAYALCLFDLFDQIRPMLIPRLHATLISASSLPQIQRFGVSDLLSISSDAMVASLAQQTADPQIEGTLDGLMQTLHQAYADLAARTATIDSALSQSIERGGQEMAHQIEKLRARISKVIQNRHGGGAKQAMKLAHWIRPNEAPQERVLSALQLLARTGPELPDALTRVCEPFRPSHLILSFEEA